MTRGEFEYADPGIVACQVLAEPLQAIGLLFFASKPSFLRKQESSKTSCRLERFV